MQSASWPLPYYSPGWFWQPLLPLASRNDPLGKEDDEFLSDISIGYAAYEYLQRLNEVVLRSPVSRLEKDWDWTGPRPEKTRKNKTRQDWWLEKTTQKPVFMDRSLRLRPVWTGEFVPLIYPFKRSPRSPKTVNIWLRNKINYAMLTKIVDFAEYYCINFNSQPYLMFLGSF